jgi:hypothetical protein
MDEITERALNLVAQLRQNLDTMEMQLRSKTLPRERVVALESMLVDRRWSPKYMGLTGPSGYDPKPVYVKCDKCSHYRLEGPP